MRHAADLAREDQKCLGRSRGLQSFDLPNRPDTPGYLVRKRAAGHETCGAWAGGREASESSYLRELNPNPVPSFDSGRLEWCGCRGSAGFRLESLWARGGAWPIPCGQSNISAGCRQLFRHPSSACNACSALFSARRSPRALNEGNSSRSRR